MPDRKPTTTERGYGNKHQKARRHALAALVDGTPCQMCSEPMFRSQELHLDHRRPLALGGDGTDSRLVHASCNTRAGQQLRTAIHRRGARAVEHDAPGWYSPAGHGPCSRQWLPDYVWRG